jgi:hypothetical protein
MRTIGLSDLEMRGIVERAFEPLTCVCETTFGHCFTLRIEDPHTGKVYLVMDGISEDRFASSREISNLIAQVRAELESVKSPMYHLLGSQRSASRAL